MSEIILEPGNPLDISPKDLDGLQAALRDLDPSMDVRIAHSEQRGYGVTWWEVLFIWVSREVAGVLLKEVTRLAVEWARSRFDQPDRANRPKSVTILGPDGKPLLKVKLDPKTREVEEEVPVASDKPRAAPNVRD